MIGKFAIYTTIVGGYDIVKQPLVVDDRFDYILFTDDLSQDKIGVWEVRPIPYEDDDLLRLSRYPKILPEQVLPEYWASLYIDGTLQISSSYVYERFIELINNKTDWGGIKHYYRDCIYDEICGIVTFHDKATHDYECIRWYSKLLKDGFPKHFGLYENNVIFRLHNETTKKIDEIWWCTLQKNCRRDQFSLMWIFWKNNINNRDYFLPPNTDAKHTEHFIYKVHDVGRKNTELSFHERLRRICWSRSPYKDIWYGYILEHASRIPFPSISLALWEIYAMIRYVIPGKFCELLKNSTQNE